MRFDKPYTGEERVVSKFALLPICAGDEVRWLERCFIHQSYGTDKPGWNNDWFEEQHDLER